MPTSHARVQVTLDPVLDGALRRAAPHLRSDTRAGQIRELALRGAEEYDDFDRRRYDDAVAALREQSFPGLLDVVAQRHAPTQ